MNAKKLLAVAVTVCLLLCAMLPLAASAVEIGTVGQYPTVEDGACTYDTTTGGTALITVPAGEYVAVSVAGGTGAEIAIYAYDTANFEAAQYQLILDRINQPWFTGEGSGTLGGDGFSIINANAFDIYVKFAVGAGGDSSDPIGSYNNPEPLPDMGVYMGGQFTHDFIDATEPYHYKWTAAEDGKFSVTILGTDGPNGFNSVGWMYYVENPDGNQYGTYHWNDDDPVVATDSVSVSAGETVVIMVATYDPTNYSATLPLGGVTFQVGFQAYGSAEMPYPLNKGVNEYNIVNDLNHYSYTATTETKIVLSGAGASWEYNAGSYDEMTADANGDYVVVLDAGESIVLNPAPSSLAGSDITITVAEKGSEEWPVELTIGDHAAANTWWPGTYYTWTGEDAGLLIVDFGTYTDWMLIVNDVPYSADEGDTVAVFEVAAGETAVNVMDWGWSWNGEFSVEFEPFTTENAPAELKEGDNYIAVPSKKGETAGKAYATIDLDKDVILTIENYWSGISVDGTAVAANRLGVLTVLLAAGEHEIVLENTLEEFVELTVNVAEPALGSFENPIEVSVVGKMSNTSVAAGSEINYAVNSKLDGTTLTVKGDVIVMVNGSVVEGKDGVVTVTLKASGATMIVTVVNDGTAAATYEASIDYPENPKTGVSIALPVLAMLMSACGAVVVGKKKF